MQLKPGSRLQSAVCDTQVVVVRVPADDVDLRCGGHPMVVVGEAVERVAAVEGFDGGSLMGKRYTAEELGLEVLCSKAGTGALSVGDELLPLKDAKPLPASD
jgi:hypothetical protein